MTFNLNILNFFPDYLNPVHLLNILGPWAIVGILCIVIAETGLMIGFFLPGDSLLFTAGMFCATKAININIYSLMILIFMAAFCGNQIGYFIGYKAGKSIFNKPNSILFKTAYVEQTHVFFQKYGGRAVILAYFIPIVRTFSPVAAGVSKMKYRKFFIFNLVGASAWGCGITFIGYYLGHFAWIGNNIDKIFISIILISSIPVLYKIYRKKR